MAILPHVGVYGSQATSTESKAQLKRGGQWKGAYHWDYNQNRNDANWPVVLHLN